MYLLKVSPALGDFLTRSEEFDTAILWTMVHKISQIQHRYPDLGIASDNPNPKWRSLLDIDRF